MSNKRMVLVPCEPIPAMQSAGERVGDYPWDESKPVRIYRAMTAAAPNGGKVSRERLAAACDAALAAQRNGGGTNAIAHAVIAALDLEIEQ